MCGLDLAHELLTCVCNRQPENSTWVSPKGHWLNLSETCLENLSQKLPFQTSVLLPGLMPVSSVAHGKNVRVFSHQSLLKPESPRTKSCPLLLLKSALCCPSLFITTSNAFLRLSPGLFPHLGLLLTWTLTWGLAHLDAHLEPCSPGCSPGPLLTWGLAHLDSHLEPCSPGPLLTWMLTWALAHLGPSSPGCSPGPLLTWALAHLGYSLLQGLLSFSVFSTTQTN